MSYDKRPSDREIESISRMARESSGFLQGLAHALRPREARTQLGIAPWAIAKLQTVASVVKQK